MKGKLTANGYLTEFNAGKNIYQHTTVLSGGKIWCFGGNTSTSLTTVNTKEIRMYDIETDIWEAWTDDDMPTRIKLGACAEKDGIIYFFGGVISSSSTSSNAYAYDTDTRTWSDLESLPASFKSRQAIVIDNEIWIIGGSNSALYVYDITTNTYRTITATGKPTASTGQVGTYANGKIYMFCAKILYIYDIKKNLFTTKALPVSVNTNAYAFRIDKKIYLMNPVSTSLTAFSNIEIYSFDVNTENITLEQTIEGNYLLDGGMQYTTSIQTGNKLYFLAKVDDILLLQPMCLSYHVYAINEEHLIETTDANQITGVSQVRSVSILGEEPVGTRLRFAMSFDGRQTYHVFKNGAWGEIVSTDVLNSGMSMTEITALTSTEFEAIINSTTTIDFMIGMDTTDEDESPKLKSIGVVKLEK